MTESNYWTRKRIGRRAVLRGTGIGLAGLAGAALIGCGGGEEEAKPSGAAATSPPTTTAATAVVTEEQKRGGFLRLLMPIGYQGANLDPYLTDTSVGINTVMGRNFYESLINIDFTNQEWRNSYSLVPWLAAGWEQADKVTYVLSIRPGVKFHNGATLTTEDVSFTYKRATAPTTTNSNNWKTRIGAGEVVDAQKFRLIAKAPDAEFLEAMNGGRGQVAIMPKSAADAGVDFSKKTVGTGPFRLERWQADGNNSAARFEDYWQKGRPYLDGLRIALADDATQSAAFIAKETDILTRNDRVQAEPILKALPDAKTERFPSQFIYGISFNLSRKPFDDLRVRRAIHLALNRADVDAAANFGDGKIGGPMMIEQAGYTLSQAELLALPGYRTPKDADIAEALKLLDAAGYKGGFKAELVFNQTFAVAPVYGEAIQAQLAKMLAIQLKLVPADGPTSTKRRSQTGDFDTYVELPGGATTPGGRVLQWHSSDASAKGMGLKDAELDALIDAQKVEFDDKARGAIFKKIELRLLDQAYFAGISSPALTKMWQPWINDWRDSRSQRQSLQNPSWVWMDMTKAPPQP